MANIPASVATIGQLRERVTLQALAVAVDAAGDPTYSWSDVVTLWARVRPAGGEVETLADRRTAAKDYEVTIRWRDDVVPSQRFKWRGRFLQIEAIGNVDERRRRVTLTCRDIGTLAPAYVLNGDGLQRLP